MYELKLIAWKRKTISEKRENKQNIFVLRQNRPRLNFNEFFFFGENFSNLIKKLGKIVSVKVDYEWCEMWAFLKVESRFKTLRLLKIFISQRIEILLFTEDKKSFSSWELYVLLHWNWFIWIMYGKLFWRNFLSFVLRNDWMLSVLIIFKIFNLKDRNWAFNNQNWTFNVKNWAFNVKNWTFVDKS